LGSPWVAVDLAGDTVAQARLLRHAHEVVLNGYGTPPVLRDVIVRSWERCMSAGLDPDRPAPMLLGAEEAAARFAEHPLSAITPIVRGLLDSVSAEARHLVALSDAVGVLLWSEGHPRMIEAARAPHFMPGALCSEAGLGTNAIGTAIALDHPLQVFSAEHFSRLLHGWTCAAAPVHDPVSGAILGAIDLSGSFRTAHPHTLALVSAVARAAELQLARERRGCDAELVGRYLDRLPAAGRRPSALVADDGRVLAATPRGWLGPCVELDAREGRTILADGTPVTVEPTADGAFIVWAMHARERRPPRHVLFIRALAAARPALRLAGRPLALSERQAELLTVLALHPAGLSARSLARCLYRATANPVTVRAEIARLRPVVGDLVDAQPYRLTAEIRADFLDVETLLGRGRVRAALDRYAGPLLPRSRAPSIVARREALEAAVARARVATPRNPPQIPRHRARAQ
jgi:GAF domain